jgi:hypothetical protein
MALTTRAGRALTAVSLTSAVLVSVLLTVGAGHASAGQIHPQSIAAEAGPVGLPICDSSGPCPLDLLRGNQAPAPSDSDQSHAYGDPAEP